MRQPLGKRIAALPIRQKIRGIAMVTTLCALLLAGGAFVLYDFHSVRRSTARDLDTLAGVVASNSAAALMFRDVQACGDILSGLRARPSIIAGTIYATNGEVLGIYGTPRPPELPAAGSAVIIGGDGIHVFRPVKFRGEVVGMLYLASDLREMQRRMYMQMAVAGGILALALLVASVMAARLQGLVTEPLLALVLAARRVTLEKDYSVRVKSNQLDQDEIGAVMHAFNEMLGQIESRDEALGGQRALLELQVQLRTSELTVANDELLAAKDAAESIAEVNAQLARQSALILNAATDGILGVDLNNRLTFLNPAGAHMLGVTVSELEGRSIHSAIHHSYADGTPWPEEDCPTTQALARCELVNGRDDILWRKDGTWFPVERSSTAMFDEDGNQLGAVMIFRDVTERRAIERLKSEFVSTVSHELRTPLTSIRGALGLLSSGVLGAVGDKGRRMLEIAVSNTDRLVRLINDILDLERIESGKVELQRAPVDALALMIQAIDGVQAMADAAGVRLTTLPATATLWGDSDRIIQTLTNLLGNAIKFSSPETTVTLSGVLRENDFVFRIADQGRGVPEAKLETIFERFSQVDGSDSRDKGGSGLGLAICKSIVDEHGGRIWAESNAPAGSLFQFTIPLERPNVALREPPAPGRSASPSVLLVEDDIDLAKVMTAALQNRGIATTHAATGRDAVQHCRQDRPSLIVLELVLPDMDGFAVVAALRESAAFVGIPLLVYSALDVGVADQARLRLGRTEFLTKSRSSLADFEGHVVRLLDTVTTAKHAA